METIYLSKLGEKLIANPIKKEEIVYQFIPKMPEFPGGYKELNQYLAQEVSESEVNIEDSTMGRVFVECIIDTNGTVRQCKILKGIDRI